MKVEPRPDVEVWFRNELEQLLPGLITKANERGAYDLYLLGRTMAGLINRTPGPSESFTTDNDRKYYLLLGILFYAEGKIARALSALKDGRLPNSDDWLDLSIYGRMAGYIMEYGQWP